ncbi:hypothetical protein AXG93_3271s1200 [Marchantia polymorpha subsp. ruderalis]|uniref:Uncharacterized protein n=1 Tax=Marchantia polymorpha subsp. ruderalis TaxID=1480154 RepID=A0A176VNH0_MARPO|nr:hypothetical protein AXG93_3271s1200 [Marchantia polymorpha subsp. ruderalis]
MRVRRPVPTKLRTANVRARTKMKARRLILVDGSSIESSVVASQGRLTSAEWAELEADVAGTEEKEPSERGLWSSKWRRSAALEGDAPNDVEEMETEKEEEFLRQNSGPSFEAVVGVVTVIAEQVESLTADRAAAKASLEEKKKQLQESESKCVALQRRLTKQTKLRKFSEKDCESLRTDIETTRRATVDLRDRLEESRMAFNEESRQVDKLTAELAKRYEIETKKWLQLRDLECQVTAMIACSVGGQRQLARKLDVFLFGLDETKENLELELTAILCRLGLERISEGVVTAGYDGVVSVCSSRHSK